jgi:pimeloyl-ACP methyl ester carboxylesterase
LRAEIIAGGGHVPHRELPERISSRIAAFCQKSPDSV